MKHSSDSAISARWLGALLVVSFLCGGLLVGLVIDPVDDDPQVTYAVDRLSELTPEEKNVVEIFEQASPSVVHVSNVGYARFGLFSRNIAEVPNGSGAGIVWDKKGHIVTNYHVIHQANAVNVTFADQTSVRAVVVGTHPDKDLAVLRVDVPEKKLKPILTGSSRNLLIGQSVLAIGNPFGLDHTLTTGVVSYLGREIKSLTGRPIQDMIQTDAAINKGNSGGPLLDLRGRLIGTTTAIYSPSGASAGIGFAIPVDTVKMVVSQLIQFGRFVKPGLGISLFKESRQEDYYKRLFGISDVEGVILITAFPDQAAARSGLRGLRETRDQRLLLGDVMTAIDGRRVGDADDVYRIVDRYQIGDTVEVTYLRGGTERKVKVKLQSISD